jgi:hypothetical protein
LVVSAQLNFTAAGHTHADATPGPFGSYEVFQSGLSGTARILWRALQATVGGGTFGQQWAYLLIGLPATGDLRAVSASNIPAATGPRDGATTPGVGAAKLYDPPSGPAGSPWQPQAGNVVVENWMRGSIPGYKPLLLRESRTASDGTHIYTVVAEGCTEIPSG